MIVNNKLRPSSIEIISYRNIAKKVGINESALKKHLNTLKEKGFLKRVGGAHDYREIKIHRSNNKLFCA